MRLFVRCFPRIAIDSMLACRRERRRQCAHKHLGRGSRLESMTKNCERRISGAFSSYRFAGCNESGALEQQGGMSRHSEKIPIMALAFTGATVAHRCRPIARPTARTGCRHPR